MNEVTGLPDPTESGALAAELDAIALEHGMALAVSATFTDTTPIVSLRADEPYYPASTIKVPIMAEVFHQAHLGRFSLSDTIPLSPEDQVTGSGVLQSLSPGLSLSIRDLVTLMIIVSDNTATNMLIDLVGAKAVTDFMTSLGLTKTVLLNKLQVIPTERTGANMTSAGDLTLLLLKIAQGQVVSYDACRRMVDVLLRQTATAGIAGNLPTEPSDSAIGAVPPVRVASKSGMIQGINHDIGLVLRPKNSYAVSIFLRQVPDPGVGVPVIARISRRIYDHVVGLRG